MYVRATVVWKHIKRLNQNLMTRYRNGTDKVLGCHKCGANLPKGSSYWSHGSNGKGRTHTYYYCDSCYDKLWL